MSFEGRRRTPDLHHSAVEALEQENRSRGVDPDWRTAGARWKRLEDIPEQVLCAAIEAVTCSSATSR